MSTVVIVPQPEFDAAFDETCMRLELKYLGETNHRNIASSLESAALMELHRSFVYEVRNLQARLAKGFR
jgi:hypothetical protein